MYFNKHQLMKERRKVTSATVKRGNFDNTGDIDNNGSHYIPKQITCEN